jgi:hypothetical protein
VFRQLTQAAEPGKARSALHSRRPRSSETEAHTSTLLIDDPPLLVLPVLAVSIGLNEAIVLQQLHYWLKKKEAQVRDGHRWVYNTYEQWREDNFPFWSVRTIQRIFTSLEKRGLVIASSFGAHKWDQTKWYRIDYEALNDLPQSSDQAVELENDNLSPS